MSRSHGLLACLLSLLGNGALTAADLPATSVEKTATGIKVRGPTGSVVIEPWSERIIHVSASNNPSWRGAYNPAVIGVPTEVKWTLTETADAYVLATSALTVRVDRVTANVSFKDPAGNVISEEVAGSRRAPATDSDSQAVSQGFTGRAAYFGLGQHPNGMMAYNGSNITLQQANREVCVPMIVSQRGYGILWNNAAITQVEVDIAAGANPLTFESRAGGGVDYDFIYGPDLDAVVAGYRQLTGDAPLMARWTWGLLQSKERYTSQAEFLDIAAKYRQLQIPFDGLVQDWQYWVPGQWGAHVMDPARYPNPKGMLDKLHEEHVHALISVWPRFDVGLANTKALDAAGALFPPVYQNVYPAGQGRWYDPYSKRGRDLYWAQIFSGLGRLGFDGWWLDASEAELGGRWGELAQINTGAGPGSVVYNAYPLMHTTAVHDGMRRDQPGKRVFILTRSAYAGQQRNGAITWSGDTNATWDHFRKQVPEALNFSLSGIPYWSADIGGFFSGDPRDPHYAELFTRWYQFGVFNPMFRVHGTSHAKELWRFDADTQKILLSYDQLRYRLIPYIYSLSWDVTRNRGTLMRPLVMDFQDDPHSPLIADQYMFGKALLVNPVVQEGARVRTVYLPGTTSWYNFWSGESMSPGQIVAAPADLATLPLFVHAGSILPLGPKVQYAEEKTAEPMELRVYPGTDGQFTLYDDAGDGYGYEKGEYATIDLSWNDSLRELTLGARKGKFPGMIALANFSVSCGASSSGTLPQAVSYRGQSVTVHVPNCK